MFAGITGWHALIIVAVLILIFGATRLPALAQGLGHSIRVLRLEARESDDDTHSRQSVEERRG